MKASASAPSRSTRHRAREYALQGIYQWLLAGGEAIDIHAQIADDKNFAKADTRYFATLLRGTIAAAAELETLLKPALDRPLVQLSPVEHAILLLAAFELRDSIDIPFRVVLNEAVELAKTFGGTDGHKYVNGVLDKIAPALRSSERASGARVIGAPAAEPDA